MGKLIINHNIVTKNICVLNNKITLILIFYYGTNHYTKLIIIN